MSAPFSEHCFIFTHPTEPFFSYLSLTVFFSLLFFIPFLALHIYLYTAPALYPSELRRLRLLFVAAALLLLVSFFSFFFILFPLLSRFLLSFHMPEQLEFSPKIQEFVGFVTECYFGYSVLFLQPLLFYALSSLTPSFFPLLSRFKPYAVFLLLLISALLSPPDLLSFLLFSSPLLLLFELSFFFLCFQHSYYGETLVGKMLY